MAFDIDKLQQIAKPLPEERKEEMENRIRNREWLKKSAHIALAVKQELRAHGMTRQELAERMGASPQDVWRILEGKENLTLQTISQLEEALGRPLLRILPESPGNSDRCMIR
ncbi:MAG: helix-turn-helix transcriptional regulator [Bacteroidales bacterium]|nr:helix-turn-helix transcriptional regulator [Bacteroidales bacterium]